jgi:ADP-L-glycero-D-manno-heptose 6-epimerase
MIVITGGAGFIGSCLLKYLNDQGRNDILVVDNLGETSKWKNLVGKDFLDYIHKFEFEDFLDNLDNPKDIECIFHLGACSSTTELDMDYLYMNNFRFSQRLATFANDNNIKFIYASSAATYGMGENGFDDKEFFDLSPLNGYGYSKYLFDKWVIESGFENSVTGFKFFNVFGPNEYHKDNMTSMVYKSYKQIVKTGQVRLFESNDSQFEDGEQKRDFIYVKDVCKVLLEAADKDIKGIFNLGSGVANSWNELVGSVFKSLGKETDIEYIEMPDNLKEQYQNYTKAEMSKFHNAGFETGFTSLDKAVDDYVKNYLVKNKYL